MDADLRRAIDSVNGLLPDAVYAELFRVAQTTDGQSVVEIGTAHGAATIAMALGATKRADPQKIYTVDRLGGKFSSRSKYGTVSENERIVRDNFRAAGVEQMIHLFVGTSDEFVASPTCPESVDFLMLDADGRIDRDLMHFYSRMRPGSTIVIDDVDPSVHLGTNHEGVPYIDLKHRITSLLLACYESEGFLRETKRIESTAFCERGDRPYRRDDFAEFSLACYRELVFADASDPMWVELATWRDHAADVREALKLHSALPESFLKAGSAMYKYLPKRLKTNQPS